MVSAQVQRAQVGWPPYERSLVPVGCGDGLDKIGSYCGQFGTSKLAGEKREPLYARRADSRQKNAR